MKRVCIAVTGAQGVGKSTLAKGLFLKCKRNLAHTCELKDRIGQHIRDRGLTVGTEGDLETSLAFIAAHLQRERESTGEIVIFDRCIIDVPVYMNTIGGFTSTARALADEVSNLSLNGFDAILYLPIPAGREQITAAHETAEFRLRVDDGLRQALAQFPDKFHRVEGDQEERLEKAFAIAKSIINRENSDIPL